MLVGEQPGDKEDLAGHPFVGPDRALEEAGIDRRKTYVTNAVKHFKFVPAEKSACTRNPTRRKSAPAGNGMSKNSKSSNPIS